jgi:hypothetical protein
MEGMRASARPFAPAAAARPHDTETKTVTDPGGSMDAHDELGGTGVNYPVKVQVEPATEDRNRLTAAFRFFLALPHIFLIGAPAAIVSSVRWSTEHGWDLEWGSSGLLGAVAGLAAMLAWFAILFTARYPDGLRKLVEYYLHWRVRGTAYLMLLRDEYPPFGDGAYPAELDVAPTTGDRDRLTVAFRIILAIPHLIVLWMLTCLWALTTAVAWLAILITGRYPETLYGFALGVFSWSIRVEAYLLLLCDEYPPFTLRV